MAVADNGAGMNDRERQRAFGMFRRFGPERGGTGMGLAICLRIVERHGDHIWAAPNVGGGTRMCFILPDPDRARAA